MALSSAFLFSHSLSSSISHRSKASDLGLGFLSPRPDRVALVNFSPCLHGSVAGGGGFFRKIRGIGSQSSINSAETLGSSCSQESDEIPMPIVMIDQDSDSDATIVQLSFGDRLGALLDTMKALKDLGLDVNKGTVTTQASVLETKFFIMRMGRKVEDPDMLERIRLTIINNLLKYHPESSEKLAMGEFFGIKPPETKLDVDVATHVLLQDDGPKRRKYNPELAVCLIPASGTLLNNDLSAGTGRASIVDLLHIETADRPGLLLEIIKIITDINIDVESAEIDTEGLVAKDRFHVSYRGAALNSSLSQVLTNCLRYYLRRPETDEDSY